MTADDLAPARGRLLLALHDLRRQARWRAHSLGLGRSARKHMLVSAVPRPYRWRPPRGPHRPRVGAAYPAMTWHRSHGHRKRVRHWYWGNWTWHQFGASRCHHLERCPWRARRGTIEWERRHAPIALAAA